MLRVAFVVATARRLCSDVTLPPTDLVQLDFLPSSLTATVSGEVTLTFTVTNPGAADVEVMFSSGQHYDFVATTAGQPAPVWRWSMGMMFSQALGVRTIPAGGTLVFTEQWRAATGSYLMTAELLSTSHHAQATTMVDVP